MNETREVAKYLQMEFLDWQVAFEGTRTKDDFAKYLGVAPGTLGHWMNGIRKPDIESVEILAKKLGPVIYLRAGYLQPDRELRKLVAIWDELDEATKRDIHRIAVDKKE